MQIEYRLLVRYNTLNCKEKKKHVNNYSAVIMCVGGTLHWALQQLSTAAASKLVQVVMVTFTPRAATARESCWRSSLLARWPRAAQEELESDPTVWSKHAPLQGHHAGSERGGGGGAREGGGRERERREKWRRMKWEGGRLIFRGHIRAPYPKQEERTEERI